MEAVESLATMQLTLAGSDFYLSPVFPGILSVILHLVLLVALSTGWLWKRIQASQGEILRQGIKMKSKIGRMLMFCCIAVSGFYILLCGWNYNHWYRNKWSDEELLTLSDLGLKAVAWAGICFYLHAKFSGHDDQKLPFLLKIWWGAYFSISCYSLAIGIILIKKSAHFPPDYLVSDVGSVVMGLFFCCVGFWEKRDENTPLEKPLLEEIGKVNDGEDNQSKSGSDQIESPYSSAGILSFLTFFWMGSLISLGNKKVLDLEDIPQLDAGDRASGVFPVFKSNLELNEKNSSKLTSLKLMTALIISVWRDILFTALLELLCTIATYVGPYLIGTFVRYLTAKREFINEGYVMVSAFLMGKLTECLTQQLGWFKLQQMGIRIRGVLVGSIYNKGLSLSCKSKQGKTSGEIINFITVDADRIAEYTWYIHQPWLVLLQITLGMFILYTNLRIGSVAALAATMLLMLANFPLMKVQEKFQKGQMESRDRRMKATSEILRNMRILKLQGWEMKFLHRIIELRKTETGWLKKFLYTMSLTNFIFWGTPAFVSVATFSTCLLAGIPLDSGKVLTGIATIRILQDPIYRLPDLIAMIIQTKVSVGRIASFLHLDDLEVDAVQRLPQDSSLATVEITNGNFSWDLSSPNQTLTDINLKVFRGMRVAVCGAVGSGKSSLLLCILGEMPKISGIVRLRGNKAYVAQSPWIQSGTIEENILFGLKMDRQKYERVLEVCSLKTDLDVLSFGDQTVVGERGINLSGGQKQRIQIARALYQDADIYLFDDPFSAVDAHTGTHLFKECLLEQLDSKTVIYVTHQVEFLPAADLILVMKDGKIVQSGKYNNILNSGPDFIELIGAHRKALSVLDSTEARQTSEEAGICEENGKDVQSSDNIAQNEEKADVKNGIANNEGEQNRQIIQEEERQKGKVEFSVYWKYMTTAYGGALLPLILLAQVFFQILQVGSNYWISWATPTTPDMEPPISGSKLIIVYAALAVGNSFCVLASSALVAIAGYETATQLFHKMHLCIFRAPMSFFDATPSGRIINRASSDQRVIDFSFPFQLGGFSFGAIQLLAVVVIMSQTAWQVFLVFIPVVAASIWYQQYYINAARELSRLVGICKAPVIQHFAETISGSTTIRSFDQQSRFQEINMQLMDAYSRPKFHAAGALAWLCFRLDILFSMTFAFALTFLVSIPAGIIDPSIAGLAVIYGLSLNNLQVWVIWNLCTLENNVISVERIYQYFDIPSEPPLLIEGNEVDNYWPTRGEVTMHDLQVRYAPHMPLVLRGLTCTFCGGEKTGIVGRTGSGKSTLIQTLFRIVDPSAGKIMIDGIDISTIGLHDLRSRLSIIPQDPTMFEGTVRTNLDPLEEYTDEQIWEALEKCQLGDEVRKKEGKLDSTVTENGENWSMGQRQLVCLGRVLLKKSKVLVLDEATASVDTATDNLIQQTLRQHFTDSTVITIAHRITSVVDSDRVLVLDQGLIAEYDSPSKLLENKTSSFAQLVAEYTARSNSGF